MLGQPSFPVREALALAAPDKTEKVCPLSRTRLRLHVPLVVVPMLGEHGDKDVLTQRSLRHDGGDQVVLEVIAVIAEVFELNHVDLEAKEQFEPGPFNSPLITDRVNVVGVEGVAWTANG